jgi:hypothetical protein
VPVREVKMKPCHKIRPWLEWLAAGEINDQERLRVEAHVRECPACCRELSGWQALLAAAGRREVIAEAECQAIDWDAVSERIVRKIDLEAETVSMPPRQRIFSFAPLATAAVSLLVIGLGIFFWTRPRLEINSLSDDPKFSAADATRLQSGLAREEVISYLQQSQMMLTDLLKDCASEEVASWEIRLYSQKARELLLKKKYFQQNLPALEWLKVRNVSERIDWLNYEILQLEDRQLCSQINRLQRIMENEKLLLKIRLLERDLSYQPYQEV